MKRNYLHDLPVTRLHLALYLAPLAERVLLRATSAATQDLGFEPATKGSSDPYAASLTVYPFHEKRVIMKTLI
jgi:hypothetical protein